MADKLYGPYGYMVGTIGSSEDEWSLRNDPSTDAKDFSEPLFAKRELLATRGRSMGTGDADDADEAYKIGKRDGYEKAVQDIDCLTGGDGEYTCVLGSDIDGRHCPDADSMKARIVERFEGLPRGTASAARRKHSPGALAQTRDLLSAHLERFHERTDETPECDDLWAIIRHIDGSLMLASCDDEQELDAIRTMLLSDQGDDDGLQILPDFDHLMPVSSMVAACISLLERRRDVIEAFTSAQAGAGAASALPSPLPSQGEPVAWPKPVVTNPDIPRSTGIPYLDCLLHRLLDAQQDVNLAANETMSQSLADASAVMDEVERALHIAAAALAAAEARADRAAEALKPFAREADEWADSVHDDHRSLCTEPGSTVAYKGSETTFTVGDLRRARTILKETPHGER